MHIERFYSVNAESLAVTSNLLPLEYVFGGPFSLDRVDGVRIVGILRLPIFFPIVLEVVLLFVGV